MMPLPTVFATAVVTKAPAKLVIEAIATAFRGESARVETEVATAFAVSWNPFVKSNPSATTTTTTSRTSPLACPLPVLDEDRLEDIGRVLQESTAPSSVSWMSFQRMIEIASWSDRNSSPIAL